MQRPVHPSYGRVKQNVDGCLYVWKNCTYVGLLRALYIIMLLSYYIGMCIFHERQRDICRRRAY